jgi:hypothetical protein
MIRLCLGVALLAGCNFRIDGLGPSSSGAMDLAMTLPGDLSMSTADLATPRDLTPSSCTANCAAQCSPCCQESCTTGGSCSQTCPSGVGNCNCGFRCDGPNNCSITCNPGSACNATVDNTNTGALSCMGATCALHCGNQVKNSCNLDCSAGAACLLDCGNFGGTCNLNNCPTAVTLCPKNVKVCGMACP